MANDKNRQQKSDLSEELKRADELYYGSDALTAISSLTYPQFTDSGRIIMFESHESQRTVLNKTSTPRVFTNNENMVGNYSSYSYRAESNLKVTNIINKFDRIQNDDQPCLIFIYNEEKDMYDVIERKAVENLTEKYGFKYDNSILDTYRVGDIIEKGSDVVRPTSYDDYDNWGFGDNIPFMYQVDDSIIEDAIKVSTTLATTMLSTEVEVIREPLNDNDILLNIYGDSTNYKTFPDIGESIQDGVICVNRRIHNSQLLYDLKASNTHTILGTDMIKYGHGEVVDIDIYCNKSIDEIPTSIFNSQLIDYLEMNQSYYSKIKEYTQTLLDSGTPCSPHIKILNKRAKELTDPDYKIKDDNGSVFNNIVIYFLVKRDVGLSDGQKLAGRYGNKGVISKIVPDELMPVLENGKRVHVIFNTLGVYNRLTVFPLFEQSITFITNRVLERIKLTPSIKEKEDLLFGVIDVFNSTQEKAFRHAYETTCKTEEDKIEYFNIVEKYGIYIHIKSMWHEKNIYDCVVAAYKKYPWIQPYDVFIWEPTSQRYIKMMHKQVVGEMYIMKLKQTSKKGLSARSTGPINRRGVPEKTDSAKKHMDPYSKTPIRFGRQETINQLISIKPDTIAKQHLLYRSSVKGRRKLSSFLLRNGINPQTEDNGIQLTPELTNRNVEILNAYLKVMGLELVFDRDRVDLTPDGKTKTHIYNGQIYLCDENEISDIISKDMAIKKIEEEDVLYIGDRELFDTFVDDIAGTIKKNLSDLI